MGPSTQRVSSVQELPGRGTVQTFFGSATPRRSRSVLRVRPLDRKVNNCIDHDPVLILCTPRSCSSVVCAMLGRHPQLYGFPELNLFVFDTVGELWRHSNTPGPAEGSYGTGLLRVIAEFEF